MPHLWNNVLQAFICCVLIGFFAVALPYDNEYGPDYGSEWMTFMDENGTTNMINISTLPTDERGLIVGQIYFYMYSRLYEDPEIMDLPEDDSTMQSKYFNKCNCITMITHGWLSKESTEWLQNIKQGLLRKTDCNVITVDWSEFAVNPIYPWAALCTRYVGKIIAKFLDALDKAFQIVERNTSIHLIGHSLGAHVMGYAGMFQNKKKDKKVDRITGLDPARPLFEFPWMPIDFRLDKSDADYVDIIHTCGGIYGYLYSFGHADFYPNDGRPRQPGCEGTQEMIEGCSHGRSCEFFGESINSTDFVAYPCDSWEKFDKGECNDNPTLMGFPASSDREGDFYLYTQAEPAYARG